MLEELDIKNKLLTENTQLFWPHTRRRGEMGKLIDDRISSKWWESVKKLTTYVKEYIKFIKEKH